MKLGEKIRYLREVEGSLRGLGRPMTQQEIIKAVARHYDLKIHEIKSKNNSRQFVIPRQVAMFLCKKILGLSYPDIGKLFNDKHHSTVMYSVDKVLQTRASDPDFDRTLQALEQRLT